MTRYLIINADDFGMSKVFNEVILDLIKDELLRSTTVMVDRITNDQEEQINELIALSRNKKVSVGLHLEFKGSDYASQIFPQFQKFKQIFSFVPSHIDIHKSHEIPDSFSSIAEFCKQHNLPFRNEGVTFEGVRSPFVKPFFGTIPDFEKIAQWISSLDDNTYYEISFHPGRFDPNCKSSLNKDRERDIGHIKKLNEILKENNVKSVSYLDLAVNSSHS